MTIRCYGLQPGTLLLPKAKYSWHFAFLLRVLVLVKMHAILLLLYFSVCVCVCGKVTPPSKVSSKIVSSNKSEYPTELLAVVAKLVRI
jgi:hypothetical protein